MTKVPCNRVNWIWKFSSKKLVLQIFLQNEFQQFSTSTGWVFKTIGFYFIEGITLGVHCSAAGVQSWPLALLGASWPAVALQRTPTPRLGRSLYTNLKRTVYARHPLWVPCLLDTTLCPASLCVVRLARGYSVNDVTLWRHYLANLSCQWGNETASILVPGKKTKFRESREDEGAGPRRHTGQGLRL